MNHKLQLYVEDEQQFFEVYPDVIEDMHRVIMQCLEEERVPFDVEISLIVVDEEEIRAINKQYRNIDKSTDVLSFPQIEAFSNGKIIWEEVEAHQVMLGDIILCHEKAIKQAEEYGHTIKREVCFLIAHSMFHLLGYDHMNVQDERTMIDKQEHILSLLGILR
ncbi:rRNA maturation RNase YbeY [Cellulosilyticum sp. I15G10I2]|uniref:rRNA maturation RNase YbeY n=1 Tax=Cellulosilyticum sp. I15G10I2 TaxID=1892843 RepID=UPI00085C64AA|nr:rRNA maturation RNase YbeY [Cellulosilyticum sp. I15G10I2]